MNKIRTSKATKIIAVFISILFVTEFVFPFDAFALTSGPESPEFAVFSPVSASDMVNLSTGDFSYSIPVIEIPGTEGGGYALSLSYQSGNNAEQEASWVGFGWNLNPGAINRNTRGFPDDYKGIEVRNYNKTKPNWTVSATIGIGATEIFSKKINVNPTKNLSFNTHTGFYSSTGIGLSYKGLGMNINYSKNGLTFTPILSPIAALNVNNRLLKGEAEKIIAETKVSGTKILVTLKQANKELSTRGVLMSAAGKVAYGLFSFSDAVKSTTFNRFIGYSFNFNVGLQTDPSPVQIGVNAWKSANFNAQKPIYNETVNAYGYIYKGDMSDNDQMRDYYMEKDNGFSRRDYFIGMPFNNFDIFSVSGEGLSGGFRAYRDSVVPNIPAYINEKNEFKINQLGVEGHIGSDFGVGITIGKGKQTTWLETWKHYEPVGSSDRAYFRFNGDIGGSVIYGDGNTEAETATLEKIGFIPGYARCEIELPDIVSKAGVGLNMDMFGSSSYIDYHTFEEITYENLSFSKNHKFSDYYGINSDQIAEFSITTQDGMNYVYGLPVLVRNETELTVDVNNDPLSDQRDTVLNNYLVFRNVPLEMNDTEDYLVREENLNSENYKTVVGTIKNQRYPKSYLITQITNPNYVDVNDNGPDDEDYGGWTKFNYRKVYGFGKNFWYRYRTPFGGLLYNRNSISDKDDDVGTVYTGEKEVYYLESIETNTHIAFFVTNEFNEEAHGAGYATGNGSYTNSGLEEDLRQDGLGSPDVTTTPDEAGVGGSMDAISADSENRRLQKLEKIVLFSKERPDKPIKTVHFDHDYSLVPNIPNNANSSFNYNGTSLRPDSIGKLTLKRVWFTYEGLNPLKISPYEFSYEYDHSYVMGKAGEFFEDTDIYGADAQNPEYAPEYLDPWGNIMRYGNKKRAKQNPWPYQGIRPEFDSEKRESWRYGLTGNEVFDPAAWQLKKIKLPSGGEIHVQYKEKEYSYVQDKPAMAMASLTSSGSTWNYNESDSYDEATYLINVDDLGCDPENYEEVSRLITKCRRFYGLLDASGNFTKSDKKIYFKYLYALKGNDPILENHQSEYITGYANVKSILTAPINIGNPSGGPDRYALCITLGSESSSSGERATTPRQAAYEFLVNRRQGRLQDKSIDHDYNHAFDDMIHRMANEKFKGNVGDLVQITKRMLEEQVINFKNHSKKSSCTNLNLSLSYLKMPVLDKKHGGGVCVDRVMIYDKGLESDDNVVYGQQYHYVLPDGSCSGVATNEPPTMREENPLIRFMPRKGQGAFSRLTTGEEKEQVEGPLGESILPAPMVTFSRVVVENIHSNKIKNGFTVHEFYTSKDYPIEYKYGYKERENEDGDKVKIPTDAQGSGIKRTELATERDYLNLPAGIVNLTYEKLWMAQGFRFILNSMNGMVKRISGFGGKYNKNASSDSPDIIYGYLVTKQEMEYFEPGEEIDMVLWQNNPRSFTIETLPPPGKEMEIASEGKTLKDNTHDFAVDFDLTFALVPIPLFGLFPTISYNESEVSMHSTTKVISYPAILKKKTIYQDGMESEEEYVAFNPENCSPVIIRTTDSYHGLNLEVENGIEAGNIYSFNIPASWIYEEMGQKAKAEVAGNDIADYSNQLTVNAGQITTYAEKPDNSWLTTGMSRVLSASAQTFKKDWTTSSWENQKVDRQYSSASISGELNRIWRPEKSFVYEATDVSTGSLYNSGYFPVSSMFNWLPGGGDVEDANPDWIKTNEITIYSPDGNPLEEKNAMGIPSAVLYGENYNNNLPVMVASNASFDEIIFEDYERFISHRSYSGGHSGNMGFMFGFGENIFSYSLSKVYSTAHLKEKGGHLKFWLYPMYKYPLPKTIGLDVSGNTGAVASLVSQNGKWGLYEAHIKPDILPSEGIEISVELIDPGNIRYFMIDDVRFQPADASANCFVYDQNTYKLLTQFDDQHFGLYYTYNQKGELTHKSKETERGMFAIEESHYNIPEIDNSIPVRIEEPPEPEPVYTIIINANYSDGAESECEIRTNLPIESLIRPDYYRYEGTFDGPLIAIAVGCVDYDFVSWSGTYNTTTRYMEIPVEGDIHLQANYDPKPEIATTEIYVDFHNHNHNKGECTSCAYYAISSVEDVPDAEVEIIDPGRIINCYRDRVKVTAPTADKLIWIKVHLNAWNEKDIKLMQAYSNVILPSGINIDPQSYGFDIRLNTIYSYELHVCIITKRIGRKIPPPCHPFITE